MKRLIVVLHDVGSQSKINDFVRVALAFRESIEAIVISRPSGAGAMYGVPEASKALYKESLPLIVIPDLPDLRELFPERKKILVSPGRGREISCLREIGEPEGLILVFSGNETGFSKKDLETADEVVTLRRVRRELPSDSMLAILMYLIERESDSLEHESVDIA